LGADVVTLANAASIEWNLHSCGEFSQIGGGQVLNFRIGAGSNGPTAVVSFSSEKVTWKTGLTEFVPAYPNNGERDRVLRISCKNEKAVIIWCICVTGNPPELQLQTGNHATWTFPDGTVADFDGTWISLRGTS
jgi:hypothetical protein